MRVGKATHPDCDLRITHWDNAGILTMELTWAEWDVLAADATHLRATGEFRDLNAPSESH